MRDVWDVEHLAEGSSKPALDPDQVYIYNMRFCPYAQRGVLVLLAKNVSFKVININLKKKPDWFVGETFGKVPVLLYKGDIIPESLIVSDLVDEMFAGPKMTPEDPIQKAKDRVLLEVFNRVVTFYYKSVFSVNNDDASSRAAILKEISANLQLLMDELVKRGTPYFSGPQAGMVDYMMWPWIERLGLLDKLGLPFVAPVQLEAYEKAMWQTDAVKRYGLNTDVHWLFMKQYVDKKADNIDYDFLLNTEH